MQSSKEQQGKIRKLSSVISAKKQRKTIEWERLEISSKIRDTKGIFGAKMSTVKDRNDMGIREAEDIMRWLQEYTEEPYENLQDPDNDDGT